MPFGFEHPHYLWLLLLAIPVVWLGVRSLATLDTGRRWLAIAIRLALLTLLVFILAGFQMVKAHTDMTVVAVVDQSDSVQRFARPGRLNPLPDVDPEATGDAWALKYLAKAAADRKSDDKLALVGFDGKPFVRAMPSSDLNFDPGAILQPVDGSDIASSIRLAMAMFPANNGKRMVLVSDGNDTVAGALSLLDAAREAKAAGIPIDILPIEYKVENEVTVDAVYNPVEARQGQTVGLRIVLRATKPARGQVYIKHDGSLLLLGSQGNTGASVKESDWTPEAYDSLTNTPANAANPIAAQTQPTGINALPGMPGAISGAEGKVSRYVCIKTVDLPLAYAGINRFEVEFQPEKGFDQLPGNNKAESFTLVSGKGKTLFVDGVGGDPGNILPKNLQARGYDISVISPGAFPTRLADLQRYDCIIFQNVPIDDILPGQQSNLSRYVTELGGGFVMIGGPDSFGAGGWTGSPIDKLLPVECQIPNQKIMPSGALVIVLDHSGSMGSPVGGTGKSQQDCANEAACLAIQTLYPDDLVCVVVFDDGADIVVPMGRVGNSAAIQKAVKSISPSGGTNIITGLDLAATQVNKLGPYEAAVRHVVLLTDGQSADGNYRQTIGNIVKAGGTVSTVGVGDGVNGGLLQNLAQMGGGTYYPIKNPKTLPQVFIKEARTIRKKLIKEEPFVPTIVSTGSPITAGISNYPAMKGFVLTGEKRDARVFTPLVGPEKEPIFAHWQIGLGRSAAFTSDASNRWATPWLAWNGYSDFWVRTLRLIARPGNDSRIDMTATAADGKLKIKLDAAGSLQEMRKSGSPFVDFMRVKGSVVAPDGTVQTVSLLQTGPGLYEAETVADVPGSYIVSLIADDNQGSRHAVFGGTTRPPGNELRRFESNRNILEQVAQITGGRVLSPKDPSQSPLFDRTGVEVSRSIKPMWYTLLTIALILFILDVATRRVAFDIAGTLARYRKSFANWRNGVRTADQPADAKATLSALKKAVGRDPSQPAPSAPGTAPLSQTTQAPRPQPRPSAQKKFEADPKLAAPTSDLDQSIGGAGNIKSDSGPQLNIPKANAKDEGPTTNRLLAAKKRAQDRMTDENEKK
jgi:Ca-activated chloride channel homolog